MAVRDPIVIYANGTDSHAAERENSGRKRSRVQLIEQVVDRDLSLDVRGILDDQVRQGGDLVLSRREGARKVKR
jgi:hypothetical protein